MNRFAALISVIGVLIIGVLIGVLGTYLYFIDEIRRPDAEPRFRPDAFVERLTEELDLTREQLDTIRAIGRKTRERADALHRDMLPRVRAHMEDARTEMEALLTAEQRAKFEKMHQTERRRIEQFLLGSGGRNQRGRPRGGPPPRHRPGAPPPGGGPRGGGPDGGPGGGPGNRPPPPTE